MSLSSRELAIRQASAMHRISPARVAVKGRALVRIRCGKKDQLIILKNKVINNYQKMADVHSRETRSFNMQKIKAKDSKPEIIVRKFLHGNGFRYSLHNYKLPGKPDIVLAKYKTVVFVNGCFWHAHENCKYFKIPETKREWWKSKLLKNRKRDELNCALLTKQGWNVITVWECELKKASRENRLEKLIEEIR